MKTGIAPLDLLLFGEPHEDMDGTTSTGFHPGEVVLIRGEPGSGKTTLALQIASGHLSANRGETVQIMSLEESDLSMIARCRRYKFTYEQIQWIERHEAEKVIKDVIRHGSGLAQKVADTAAKVIQTNPSVTAEHLAVATAAEVARHAIEPAISGIVDLLFRAPKPQRDVRPQYSRLVIIDSLNALMNLLLKEFPSQSPRLLFNTFCQGLRQRSMPKRPDEKESPTYDVNREPPVILIIGEHHFHEQDSEKYLPESFFCDTEIVLRPEAIRLPSDADVSSNVTLGYDIAAIVDPQAKHLESRSFCRVLKARSSPRQSRRCAYDIEAGQGFRFFETYPGDGKLMLFAENEQQRVSWESFFGRDLIDSYPALRYETFTMEGLETVYESSRRLLHLPLSTDMYLSSLDSYWVMGYRDYKLKTRINDRLKKRMRSQLDPWTMQPFKTPTTPDLVPRFAESTCACMEYPGLVNDLASYSLLRAELALLNDNCAELQRRPTPIRVTSRERVEQRLKECMDEANRKAKELRELRLDIENTYDALCNYLFAVGAANLLKEHDLFPEQLFGESFLRPFPRSRLSLYGQYNASLLPILVREEMHRYRDGEDYWLSVPYDANVGIFVARLDLLRSHLADTTLLERYKGAYQELKTQEERVFTDAIAKAEALFADDSKAIDEFSRRAMAARADCIKARNAGPGSLPSVEGLTDGQRLSWDQVISLTAAARLPFGVETRSFDTMMAFFLELVWNCGGKLEVSSRYKVANLVDSAIALLRAFHYFGSLFKFPQTPRDQTIDPVHYTNSLGAQKEYGNWLFSRFWYSTLVDALTASESAGPDGSVRPQPRRFVWRPAQGAEIEILSMPSGVESVDHFTCCGDWSFGLLEGSENLALACDLVSNLMGVVKVNERGLRGSCLPTVSQFYWRHRNEPCVPQTIREDLLLPQLTFGELGRRYMGTPDPSTEGPVQPKPRGIMRHRLFDYRHCSREIYGELLAVKRSIGRVSPSAKVPYPDADMIVNACISSLRGIEELRNRYIFIKDAFRQDVAEMPLHAANQRREFAQNKRRLRRVPLGNTSVMVGGELLSGLNVSRGGCAVESDRVGPKGTRVKLMLGTEPMHGRVAWSRDGRTGIEFSAQIPQAHYFKVLSRLRPLAVGKPIQAG